MRTDPRQFTDAERHAIRCCSATIFAINYGPCVAYVGEYLYHDGSTRFQARGYIGKAVKASFYICFKTFERMGEYCDKWAASIASHEATKAVRRQAASSFRHTLKTGDVLYSMWGYDQTNVDYYQVTKLIGSHMVEVRQIGSRSEGGDGWTGRSWPAVDSFTGEAKRYRVSQGNRIRVASYCSAGPLEYKEIGGARIYETTAWTAYA